VHRTPPPTLPDFARFDRRHYPTVPVREGYEAWAPTYDETVDDVMDLALLERIDSVEWSTATRAADLGCGSGRTAAWLRRHNPTVPIDGVDLTPAMLRLAQARGLHQRLVEADVRATTLDTAAYDLVLCVLVDEHLPELRPLYAEARRLLRPRPPGAFVIVGVHPFFLMTVGMPTHYDDPDRGPVAMETHVHLPSEHVAAATDAGFGAGELHEALVDDEFVRRKPGWAAYGDVPFSYAWAWPLA
jgi:SAM-dependent methyltransferase